MPGCTSTWYFRKNIKNRKTFQKITKKIMHVPEYGTHHRDKFRAEMTSYAPCGKNDKILTENEIQNFEFLSEFCHFCTGSILCHFGAKFFTVVQSILRYVHDFFRNFSKSFLIFLSFRKKREQVSPGSNMNFRIF